MDLSDINPVGVIGGIIGGLFAFMLAGQMMPSGSFGLMTRILTFAMTSVVCYFVVDKMLG